MNKSSQTILTFILLAHLQFWGCSFFTAKTYPEPIVLSAEPVMSLRYTSTKVSLLVPIEWNEGPHAAAISIFQRNDPASPLFQAMIFPNDSLRFILPHNVFSKDSLGNVLKVDPSGGFRAVHHFFSAPKDTVLEFPGITIP